MCVQVPVIYMDNRLWVRISAQVYNTRADYQKLINALQPLAESAVAASAWHLKLPTQHSG